MLITALVAAAVSIDPAAADSLTLTASADARIDRLKPNTNYGQRMTLRADADGPLNALLKFDVGDLTVLDARLRLRVQEGSAVGPMVSAVSTAWSEETVTWNTAPPSGTALVALPAAVTGETIEADVTSLLSGEASFAFRISTMSRDGMSLYSAEMGSAPELIITTGVDTTATPVASPTASVVATASASGSSASPSPSPAGSQPGSPSPVPVGGNGELAFPIRAAFYYPWFPEAWNQQGMNPFTRYHPTVGYYDGGDAGVIRSHVEAMLYGHIGAGIASWWGQGSPTDGRIPALLKGAAGTPFRWTIYYEPESLGDPTVSQLTSDLAYLRDRYGSDPAYLRINGKFVVFVYADGSDGCAMADRWRQANTIGAYIVLKVFAGYRNCASQPAGWHQYAPASATDAQAGYSFAISPGFFKANETSARLGRDLTRWKTNIREMIASAAPFQLVTTFNEWGEGTSVEGASEWASSSQLGSYLDALHSNGADGGVAAPTPNPTPTPTPAPTVVPTPPPPPPTSGTAVLVGAGDIAACSSAGDEATAALLDTLPGTVFTTGDNVYDNGTASEFANCYDPSWGRHRSRTRPAPGNHDYHTSGAAGYFGYFGARAGDSSLGYYAYDLGQWRVYALNSNCGDIGGCGVGSPQYQWLTADLAANPRECVVAYWHHARWSSGAEHGSHTFMQPIWQALYDAGAELVVAGHDHTYERFAPQDGAGNHDATNGVREFVVGTGGRSHYSFGTILPTSEARNSTTFGVLKLTLRDGGYAWDFVPVAGQSYTDSGSGSCHATPPLAFNTSITTGYAATLD